MLVFNIAILRSCSNIECNLNSGFFKGKDNSILLAKTCPHFVGKTAPIASFPNVRNEQRFTSLHVRFGTPLIAQRWVNYFPNGTFIVISNVCIFICFVESKNKN